MVIPVNINQQLDFNSNKIIVSATEGLPFSTDESVKNIKPMLENYIEPSIQDTSYINEYSTIHKLDNFQFRVFKDSEYITEKMTDMKTVFVDKNREITQSVVKQPRPSYDSFDPMNIEVMAGNLEFMTAPKHMQTDNKSITFIWNDGKPGVLFDVEYTNGIGMLYYAVQDEQYQYSIRMPYLIHDDRYTKSQLINMVIDGQIIDSEIYSNNVTLIDI